jgi:hypothetical protein
MQSLREADTLLPLALFTIYGSASASHRALPQALPLYRELSSLYGVELEEEAGVLNNLGNVMLPSTA